MEAVLFQIRPNKVHQVLSGPSLFGLRSRAPECVVANVALDHLSHQTIHGAARGGDDAQHIAAFGLAVERPRQRLDLSTNAGHSMRQFFLLADRMRHAGEYTPVVYRYTWVGYMIF